MQIYADESCTCICIACVAVLSGATSSSSVGSPSTSRQQPLPTAVTAFPRSTQWDRNFVPVWEEVPACARQKLSNKQRIQPKEHRLIVRTVSHTEVPDIRLFSISWHIYYLLCQEPDEEMMFSFFWWRLPVEVETSRYIICWSYLKNFCMYKIVCSWCVLLQIQTGRMHAVTAGCSIWKPAL